MPPSHHTADHTSVAHIPGSLPTFREATRVWGLVALHSFGGPAGQIAVMHQLLIEERRWFREDRFLHALNYCMLLPGPEAQQLATYFGWLLHGIRGGLVAGTLFVLPGFASILVLSILYALYGDVALVEALFYGIKPAVMAIVVAALVRIGSRALTNRVMYSVAASAFVGIFFLDLPFPLIIAAAALTGYIGGRLHPDAFVVISVDEPDEPQPQAPASAEHRARPSLRRAAVVLGVGLSLWFAPIAALVVWLGPHNVYVQIGQFFSIAAVVTFGGAYAVLAYIAQQAVEVYGWLLPGEMLDGLGMAETTPGPLIQVVQFVGFLGAYRAAGGLDPLTAGVAGAVLTTWVTFVPCFVWIFLGAPYVEYLRGNRNLSAALSSITAAVVGVVLNLAVWFSLHTLFATVDRTYRYGVQLHVPDPATLDPAAAAIAVAAMVAMFKLRWSMLRTIAASAGGGFSYYLAVLA